MENQKFENWETVREELLKKYPELTREDLYYELGKEEELLERLQGKLKKNRTEIRNWLHIMG